MENILKGKEMFDVNYEFDPDSKELNLYQGGNHPDNDWVAFDIEQMEQLHAILTQILLIENAKI
jgi:hypothetical protein